MTFIRSTIDVELHLYTTSESFAVGLDSQFVAIDHPSTKKKIEGFKFDKIRWTDIPNQGLIPRNWDGSIEDGSFISGVGDEDDLLINEIDKTFIDSKEEWKPLINHGHYYLGNEEFYLFSDDSVTHYPSLNTVWVSLLNSGLTGGSIVDLDFTPKPGIPILARSFVWSSDDNRWRVAESYNKVTEFTGSGLDVVTQVGEEIFWDKVNDAKKEFLLDYSFSPPRLIFNQVVSKQVGRTPSINPTTAELEAMEFVGITDSLTGNVFNLDFSPIDINEEVVVYSAPTSGVSTLLSEGLTISGANFYLLDRDLGVLTLSSGISDNRNIYATYYKTLAIEYEPENTRDTVQVIDANLNPLTKFNGKGFVLIQNQPQTISSIELSADLPSISTDYYGPLSIGNSFSKLIALVKDTNGNPVENAEVFFEITSDFDDVKFQSIGRSNDLGEAYSVLVPPKTIDSLGAYTTDLSYPVSGQSVLRVEGYVPPTDSDDLFLFVIHKEDDILGIPKDNLLSYYESYIQSQGIDSSSTKGSLVTATLSGYDWITGLYEDFIKWEIIHRATHNMLTPTTYEDGDISTGKKTVLITSDAAAINPHTGTTPAFVPVQPATYIISNSGLDATFNATLPLIGDSYAYKSYQLVGPVKLNFRAYVVDDKRDITIYSNTISILIQISDSGAGLTTIDTINQLDESTLTKANFWDSQTEGLESVSLSTTGLLPIGWRIRSSGVTIASALNRLTFLDINPLTTPDDRITIRFTVT